MTAPELEHLELLGEIDALAADLARWADHPPDWPAARHCQALVRRLTDRADTLRIRLEAPLVVATLGGTGVGKSTLINALVGEEVCPAGRERPTTRMPTLICRPDLAPEQLGVDASQVRLVQRDLAALRDIVFLDCPDPDSTEEADAPATNLARLRALLPHCDVLLVVTTQQKYRSARVADELASAAPGAQIVFVQTHADADDDVRDDWMRLLGDDYTTGDVFFVDSVEALATARGGRPPRGDFARLVDLLTRRLAGAAASRIRRANFLDLAAETLETCRQRIDAELPAVEQFETALAEQRAQLSAKLAEQMREQLLANRRQWEARLLGEVASRWGLSPFSLVLRLSQGLGGLLARAALLRARTPAQLALWGAFEGARLGRRKLKQRRAESAPARAAAFGWDDGRLRTASIIVDGYAAEANLPRQTTQYTFVADEAARAGEAFVQTAAGDAESLVSRLAARHTGWITRCFYELLLLVMLGGLLYRLGRNYFYDSWLAYEFGWAAEPAALYGVDFFLVSAFWLTLWCVLLVWMFTLRVRRGLNREIRALAEGWNTPALCAGVFAAAEEHTGAIRQFHDELERLDSSVAAVQKRLSAPDARLGHRIG